MAVTPVLACYRTCDAAIGGMTAWQVTTGPDGPRTNVVGSCPLGDASWVTPLYHLVVVLCERDGTLVVVHPDASSRSSGPFSSKANGLATVPSIPLGVSWPSRITPQARSNSSTYQIPPDQLSETSSISVRAVFSLDRWQIVKRVPMLTR